MQIIVKLSEEPCLVLKVIQEGPLEEYITAHIELGLTLTANVVYELGLFTNILQ